MNRRSWMRCCRPPKFDLPNHPVKSVAKAWVSRDFCRDLVSFLSDNPLQALEFLKKNADKFPGLKRIEVRSKIVEKLDSYGKEFLTDKYSVCALSRTSEQIHER